jgi:hypothetical protein
MQPQEYAIKASSKNRGLGYTPLNFYKSGMQFHHMYLDGDPNIGIFIPTELHYKIGHDRFHKTSMKQMNKAALEWLACQDIIAPESYAQEYSDYQFIDAVRTCLENTTVSSAEVARLLGCNSQFAKERMKKIAKYGKLISKLNGTTWGFKLPTNRKQYFEIKNEDGELITQCEEGQMCEVNGIKITINRIYDPEN